MNSPGYQYRTTIDFGDIVVTKPTGSTPTPTRRRRDEAIIVMGEMDGIVAGVDGREIIREMAMEYLGTDYDLLRKNCCTFAHDACLRLGIHEDDIPSWFCNLSSVGAVTQDAATSTLAEISQMFSEIDEETEEEEPPTDV